MKGSSAKLLVLAVMIAAVAPFSGCVQKPQESLVQPPPLEGPPLNETPVAHFWYWLSSYVVIVDATNSYDPNGAALRFRWDFGDNATGWGVKTRHEYDDDGIYNITLYVDNGRIAGIASVTVEICEGASYDDFSSEYVGKYIEKNESKLNKWAVLEGVSDYPPIGSTGGDDLPDCHLDALNFYDYLVNYCGFPEEQVFLFLNESDNPKNIKSAINFIANHSDENSTFVYYHSGHGVMQAGREGDVIEASIAICDDGWGKLQLVFMSELKSWFSAIKSKKFAFITDSCQTGEMGGIGPGQFAPTLSEGLASEGRIVISASSDVTLAFSTGEGGAFTILFIDWAMREGKGDGCSREVPPDLVDVIGEKDGKVSLQEAYWYTWWIMQTGRGVSPEHVEQLPDMTDNYGEPFFL